jgi:hypothetical protein
MATKKQQKQLSSSPSKTDGKDSLPCKKQDSQSSVAVRQTVNPSTRQLLNIIHNGAQKNDLSLVSDIGALLAPAGVPAFPTLLAIPDRIPNLVSAYGFPKIHQVVIALLTDYVTSLNVVRNMNATQIVQCAAAIVRDAESDFLAVEDLVVFFEGAKTGKYGRILDHVDTAVIFEMLEKYREQRHQEYFAIKADMKVNGYSERSQQRALTFNDKSGTYESRQYNPEARKLLDDLTNKYKYQDDN